MRRSEIAHCLFMTRGPSFSDPSQTVIRVLLWPRAKVVGQYIFTLPSGVKNRKIVFVTFCILRHTATGDVLLSGEGELL